MKPIPISVLTAVTNSALNAASVFQSRRIEISDSHINLNRSAACKILKSRPFVPGTWHVKVGKLVRRARQLVTDQRFAAVLLYLANSDCASGLRG
jgi:hypothetical protein